jgi:hypothetical protein
MRPRGADAQAVWKWGEGMNTKLLRKVQRQILAEPDKFDNNRESYRLFAPPSPVGSRHDPQITWPLKFALAYTKAKTLRGKARVAVRRIDHFIKTKGRE